MSIKKSLKPAVVFDRDGTLIVDKIYLNDPDQIEYLPGVFEGLKALHTAGFILVGATNQSGVARGIVQLENLHEIHRRIIAEFKSHGIDFKQFYYAPFGTYTNHPMRKPNPGMLLAAAEDWDIDLKRSWMIGDRMTDVQAGYAAEAKTILFNASEAEKKLIQDDCKPHSICDHFSDVARSILTNVPK